MLRKIRQTVPLGRVLMYVMAILDIRVVEMIDIDPLLAVRSAEQLDEIRLELAAVVVDDLVRVCADDLHLTDVGFRERVLFEGVFVATGLFADLTVPPQARQAFLFHLVRYGFC